MLWRLFLGEKGLLISGIFFWNILMLSFLHHTAFSYLFTIWDLSLYSEELITMLWSSPSLGTQEKKRKPVNFDLCFPHWNIVQFAALPSVLFSFTLYFFTLKQGKHKGNALQASNSCTCYLKSTMLPLCEDEILSLSLFSINGRTWGPMYLNCVQENLLPCLLIFSKIHSLWFYIWNYRLKNAGFSNQIVQ